MDPITLTRKDTRDTVSLPPDMRWLDEYGWAAVTPRAICHDFA